MAGKKVVFTIGGQRIEREYTEEQVEQQKKHRAALGIPSAEGGKEPEPAPKPEPEQPAESAEEVVAPVKKTRSRKKPA